MFYDTEALTSPLVLNGLPVVKPLEAPALKDSKHSSRRHLQLRGHVFPVTYSVNYYVATFGPTGLKYQPFSTSMTKDMHRKAPGAVLQEVSRNCRSLVAAELTSTTDLQTVRESGFRSL